MRLFTLTTLAVLIHSAVISYGQSSPPAERLVYPTHYLSAATAAEKISALYASDKEPKVTVVAEPTTNCLLVAAPPETLREIVKILDQLDRRQSMVAIDVWVVNLQTSAEKGDGKSATATVAVAPGTRSKVVEQLAKLEKAGQATVVNHIQMTTLADCEARVQQGERKPRITASNVTATGRVSTATLDNLGTLIKVLPHVAEKDQITLDVNIEKSFDGSPASGVVIFKPTSGDEVRASSLFTLTAKNIVTLKSGEAFALSGLESGTSNAAGAFQILVAAEVLPSDGVAAK